MKKLLFSHEKLKEISKPDSYMIDDPIERAKRWIEEREQYNKVVTELEEQNSFVNKTKKTFFIIIPLYFNKIMPNIPSGIR